jgi:transposase
MYLQELQKHPPEKIVYVDESGMNNNDFYPYAYSAIGARYYEAHPGHYTQRISMIGGLCQTTLRAPFMFEGHCNTAVFEAYLEQVLVPTLEVGMLVVIDNASFHKSLKIKQLIESKGANLLYLPPYSPDLNPIENYWHKIKNCIRKTMRGANLLLDQAMALTLKEMATF